MYNVLSGGHWPLSSLLHSLDYQECMYPTPHPHVCFDGAAAGGGIWIPSQRIHQTSKLPQSADSGLLLRHPRLCSQSERVDRYYNCYLAADILRDRTWHLERVGFRPLTAQVERTEPRDWRTISYLHHGFAMRRTIGQTDSNCFGELRSFSLALKLPFVILSEEREIILLYWIVNWSWAILGNILNILFSLPSLSSVLTDSTTLVSAQSLLSRVTSSEKSSRKGFPVRRTTSQRFFTCRWKVFWAARPASWFWKFLGLSGSWPERNWSSNWWMILESSVPDSIHRLYKKIVF